MNGLSLNIMKKQIFISHTKNESDFAISLQDWIREILDDFIDVFVSSDNGVSIPLGSEWPKRIKESLENSNLVLVLVSHQSIDRKWIYFEAGAGYVREIPVIPICIGGITKEELPTPLSLLQAIEVPNSINESVLLNKIIEASDLGLPKSFKKVINSHRLKLPAREIHKKITPAVTQIDKIDFKESIIISEVKLKILDFLIDHDAKFTITELEVGSKLKSLKRRKYIFNILEELKDQGYIEKVKDNNQTLLNLTNSGKQMLAEIKIDLRSTT